MDVRDYEYIVAIAEQGGISRAAAKLFITQSALTKFLQRTEKEIGLSLFVRNGNQFLLTEAGYRYVETGRAILHLDRQLTEQLTQEIAAQKGRIRLGFSMGWTDHILKHILPAFYAEYPNITVYAKGDTSRKHIMALHNNDQDLVLVTNVEQIPGYQYISVGKSWMVLAVPEDSPFVKASMKEQGYPFPVIEKEMLEDAAFVSMPTSTNSGSLAKELCSRYQIQMRTVLEMSDVRSALDAVECGYGVCLLMSAPAEDRRIRYLSIRGIEAPEQATMLVYRSDKNLSPAMKYLVSLLLN